MHATLAALRHGLIVSCQPGDGNPMRGPHFTAGFARAAEAAGAVAFRVESAADVRAVRAVTRKPIIGIRKLKERRPVYITPTLASARPLIAAGAEIVAFDATHRARKGGASPEQMIDGLHRLGVLVMADVDSLAEGIAATEAGTNIVATTLSGYTENSPKQVAPDLALVRALARRVSVPVICEGRIHTPELARKALDAGAFAVVVGTAITNPFALTNRFVGALRSRPG
jgi:N-acylglucosamine-6-phosphate 2-epimerase